MGTYKEVDGDLLEMFSNGEFENIAHGANCYNKMGAGIAKQIKERFPEAYYADRHYVIIEGVERLGNISYSTIKDVIHEHNVFINNGYVFNLYTQVKPGPNADYDAVRLALRKLNSWCDGETVGLPKIGCGIGGLKWNVVRTIIQEEMKDCKVTVVNYKK